MNDGPVSVSPVDELDTHVVPVVSSGPVPLVVTPVGRDVEPVLVPLGSVGFVSVGRVVGPLGLVSVGSVVGPTELDPTVVVVELLDVPLVEDPVDEDVDPSSSVSVSSVTSSPVHPLNATQPTIHNELSFIGASCHNGAENRSRRSDRAARRHVRAVREQ